MIRIAAQTARWLAASRVSGHGERLHARRPDSRRALDADYISQPHFRQGLTERRIVAIGRIGQYGSVGNPVGDSLADLLQRYLQFGLEHDLLRNPRLRSP